MTDPEQIVIVGSGVIGSGIAFKLARRGVAVTLVERGCSGQSWALAQMGADSRESATRNFPFRGHNRRSSHSRRGPHDLFRT